MQRKRDTRLSFPGWDLCFLLVMYLIAFNIFHRCSPRAPRLIRNSMIPKNHAFKSRSQPSSPWNPPGPNPLNDESFTENLYHNRVSVPPIRTIVEEDSSSDNSSSIFSEGHSFSSDTTKWDSTSTDNDYFFESFFGDLGRSLSSPWQNLSDSDSSSSSSSPSPLYTRLSRNMESGTDDRGFWERIPSERSYWEGKSTDPVFYSDDQSKQYRKSSSCRDTNSGRLGSSNLSFSRSTRERTD